MYLLELWNDSASASEIKVAKKPTVVQLSYNIYGCFVRKVTFINCPNLNFALTSARIACYIEGGRLEALFIHLSVEL